MNLLYISEADLSTLIASWAAQGLVATVERPNNVALERIQDPADTRIALRCARAYTSPKALLFPARELVAVYGGRSGSANDTKPTLAEPLIILGVRNCDLTAIALMDRIFMQGEYCDPFYAEHRKRLAFVSVDCIIDAESCFCDLVDVQPYPSVGFDINLSPVQGGYIVEVATPRGEELTGTQAGLLTKASKEALSEREANRKNITEKLKRKNEKFRTKHPISRVMEDCVDSPGFDEFAGQCVECGACTNICPTCHCFYLFDRLSRESGEKPEFARLREWDSCLLADYARMAGNEAGKPNPRPRLRHRLENRFTHKYLYIPHVYHVYGCTGCGRCYDACLGGIDPRVVIKKFESK